MEKLARESSRDSAISTIFNFFCLIRITGFRIAEYGQTTQTKVDMHEYPSGNLVVKAFLPTDWVFKNEKGCLIKIHSLHVNTVAPSEVKIMFWIQKNRQNGQAITITADIDYPRSVQYKLLIASFSEPKDFASQMINQWQYSSTTKAKPNISLGVKLLKSCNQWLRQPIPT